eukprot:tig00001527_g9259.t1
MSSSNPNAPRAVAIRDVGPPEVKIVLIVAACVAVVIFFLLVIRWLRRERRRVELAEHARIAAARAELLRLKQPKTPASIRAGEAPPAVLRTHELAVDRLVPGPCGPAPAGLPAEAIAALPAAPFAPSPRAAAASPPAGEGSLPAPAGAGAPGAARGVDGRGGASCPLCAFDVRAHLAADPATRPSSASVRPALRPAPPARLTRPQPRGPAALRRRWRCRSRRRGGRRGRGGGAGGAGRACTPAGPETPLEPEAARRPARPPFSHAAAASPAPGLVPAQAA